MVPQESFRMKNKGSRLRSVFTNEARMSLAFLYFDISGLGKRIQSSLLFGETKSLNFHTKFFKIPQATQFQSFQLKQ